MKKLLKEGVAAVVRSGLGWYALEATILRVSRYVEWERKRSLRRAGEQVAHQAIRQVCPDLVVKHGPFQGLSYPEAKSAGSGLLPKLIGSYERELQVTLESICQTAYTEIVDVGCAEGYYAVGLAMRLPAATVYAYDTDEEARRLCRQMAELNGVDGRVVIGSACTPEVLKSIRFTGKGLVVCDCEGYEKTLFSEQTSAVLEDQDLLIEVHSFKDPTIPSHLFSLLHRTHEIEIFAAVTDDSKASSYDYPELSQYDQRTKIAILAERRARGMEWFFCRSKSRSRSAWNALQEVSST